MGNSIENGNNKEIFFISKSLKVKIKSLIRRKEWKTKKENVVNKLIQLFAAYSEGKFKQ